MNLIVTCPRHFERDTVREIEAVFERLQYKMPETAITDISGIVTVRTDEDPVKVVKRIAELIGDEPWSVRYSKRIIPIHRTSASDIGEIVGRVGELKSVMGDGTYRITVEKRDCGLSTAEIIAGIAGTIPNAVSLSHPDWVVLVEILGARTGVAIIRPGDLISVERTKRYVSEQD